VVFAERQEPTFAFLEELVERHGPDNGSFLGWIHDLLLGEVSRCHRLARPADEGVVLCFGHG